LAEKALISAKGRQMPFHFPEMNGPIGHQFVEVLHHHRLRKHREFMERAAFETPVKPLIKRRALISVRAQSTERFRLVRFKPLPRPSVVPSQLPEFRQQGYQDDEVHGPLLKNPSRYSDRMQLAIRNHTVSSPNDPIGDTVLVRFSQRTGFPIEAFGNDNQLGSIGKPRCARTYQVLERNNMN
jgi:hypothetical protein